ncbi:RING finger protein 186 [Enhydra lutris kenyoni]|uniref:RING finger protein 186 n=1 Tax=Enhydra lutris kenyoni TaxID=391180 RepID=A0A2Y9KBG3_ENHLU|nr:RING finger protein 186 [Enhydra lutris kenyoni]
MAATRGPQLQDEKPQDRPAAVSGEGVINSCCHQAPEEEAREAETPRPRPDSIQVPAAPAVTLRPRPGPELPGPADSEPRMACADIPQPPVPEQPQPISARATSPSAKAAGPTGGHWGSVDGDLECLVCREPYSCTRPAKLLGCQHSFCAVCLKLLLCVQDNTWSVTCPLCRQATSVPGGLICSLRDQEAVVGLLGRPWPEVRLCPQRLADSAPLAAGYPGVAGEDEQDEVNANRVAARRLAVHLILLVLLIVLILPFVYPGVIWWVLTSVIAFALLMSSVFCCHASSQRSCCPSPGTVFCRVRKHSEISSIA